LEFPASTDLVRSISFRYNPQASIQEIDPERLERTPNFTQERVLSILEKYYQRWTHIESPLVTSNPPSNFTPSIADLRKSILTSIKIRQGQSQFRQQLLKRYRGQGLISKCEVTQIIEAAHIWPYRVIQDNHSDNGLLLRADLHTLFDLNLIGINPDTLKVSISSALFNSEYKIFDGKNLNVMGNNPPSSLALSKRWQSFTEANSQCPEDG
jgi:putative restriction endonuclease